MASTRVARDDQTISEHIASMSSDTASAPASKNDRPKTKNASLLSTSAGGATVLIAQQVASRALTFIVNQILLRYLSPELLGISTQLEVYSISVLFSARESLRVAIQRQPDSDDDACKDDQKKVPKGHVNGDTAAGRSQAIVNLSYISIALGIGFAIVFARWYRFALSSNDAAVLAVPYFDESLHIYGLAAFLELLSEPCFVVVQQKSAFKIRGAAESAGTVLRCLSTCGSAIWAARNGRDIGVLPFALGQITYATVLLLVYCWNVVGIVRLNGFSLFLKLIYSRTRGAYFMSLFSRPLLSLGGSLFGQSIVKHILTQGDTLLITSLASQKAQGVYALANNYGGLVARLVFQPIEESSRNYFGKLLSSEDEIPSRELVTKARNNLQTLLKAYVLLSICVLVMGPTMAPLLLKIVAGQAWVESGAGDVLARYCFYIPLLAINGLTEAFVSSVATESEVNQQSLWMLAFSAGFAGAAYVFLGVLDLGAEGLVWANTLNMAFRIVWSSVFIASYMKRHDNRLDFSAILPKPMTIASGSGAYAILIRVAATFTGGILDIVKGAAVAGTLVVLLAYNERVYLVGCFKSLRGQSG